MAEPRERLEAILRDRYVIERVLGRGGMATVFLAHDIRHDRRVAIKLLDPELSASLGAERFLREIRVAANLRHPNILPLYDSGEGEGLLYYVMPFVEGESLADRLAREGQLGIEETLGIARQVAAALEHSHAQGVLHRDIKPGNIMLAGTEAFVTDFGIARAVGDSDRERLTSTGLVVGTPAYMSPEQVGDTDRIDGRADLYSLGCVVYEMLAGEPPFRGPNARVVLMRHATEPVPQLRTIRDTIPDSLELAVRTALAKTPADRYRSVGEFAAAIAPDRLTGATAALPFARRRWRRPALWAVILVAAAALGGLAMRLAQQRAAPAVAQLDPDLVAVLPIRVIGDDPGVTSLGIASQIAERLSASAGPRSVFPGSVEAALEALPAARRAEPGEAEAREVAMSVGAATMVIGQFTTAGSRIALSATLESVEEGTIVVRVPRREVARDSFSVLLDLVSHDILAGLAGGSVGRQEARQALTLPMLRLELAAIDAVRMGRWAEAIRGYTELLGVRPDYVPAALDRAAIAGYIHASNREATFAALRPVADRLDPEDRLYWEAIRTVWDEDLSKSTELTMWEDALFSAPAEPLRWFLLGEALFHNGPWLGIPDILGRSAAAFRRALALDPRFVPAMGHLIDLAASAGDTATVRRLGTQYLGLAGGTELYGYYRWRIAVALDDSSALAAVRATLDSLPEAALERLVNVAQIDGVALPDAARAAAALWSQSGVRAQTRWAYTKQRELALNQGRPGEALAITVARNSATPTRARDRLAEVVDVLHWGADSGLAIEAMRRVGATALQGRPPEPESDDGYDLCAAGLWHASRGPADTARMLAARMRASLTGEDTPFMDLCSAVADAEVAARWSAPALARARERLDSIAGSAPSVTTWVLTAANLTAARLLEADGQNDRALLAVRRRLYITDAGEPRVLVALATMLREEGRLALATGDTAGAGVAWNRYLALRGNHEPVLDREVQGVERSLAGLGGNRR